MFFETSCLMQTREKTVEATENNPLPKTVSAETDIKKWIAPTIFGLKIGTSAESDVKKLFGNPDADYTNRDRVFENDKEDETVLEYNKLSEASGKVSIIVGKRTKIVKAVSVYPNDMSADKFISEYGDSFFQMDSGKSICINETQKPGKIDENIDFPYVLVYPNLGISADVRKHLDEIIVGRIDYLVKCELNSNNSAKNSSLPVTEQAKTNAARKWMPSSFSGIEIGKSTRDDLIKKFGKPVWEGDEELEGEEEEVQKALERHSGKRMLLEFKDAGGIIGKTSVMIGEKDKIVQAIDVYPATPFTKEEIISKYGGEFVEKYANDSICSAIEKPVHKDSIGSGGDSRVSTQNNLNPLEMLVFPKIGMYAAVSADGKIDRIGFSLVCAD